ncbi:hypothetical protein [Bacillus wiedmannii]|nr:hypothetical protein [Bacillus wiedmannii]SCM10737.1 Uncharacterized protein BCRIVMBC120_05333 [Bacillus wiedmannii]
MNGFQRDGGKEKFQQAKFADEGKGSLIITYAIDLYVISIPLKVKKYNSL